MTQEDTNKMLKDAHSRMHYRVEALEQELTKTRDLLSQVIKIVNELTSEPKYRPVDELELGKEYIETIDEVIEKGKPVTYNGKWFTPYKVTLKGFTNRFDLTISEDATVCPGIRVSFTYELNDSRTIHRLKRPRTFQ